MNVRYQRNIEAYFAKVEILGIGDEFFNFAIKLETNSAIQLSRKMFYCLRKFMSNIEIVDKET